MASWRWRLALPYGLLVGLLMIWLVVDWRLGLVAVGLAVGLGLGLGAWLLRPVQQVTDVIQRMKNGDLEARLLITKPQGEIDNLILALNELGEQLQNKIATLAEGQQRLVAILDHLADGVVITDSSGRVEMINPAASQLLNITPQTALNDTFAQVVRHHQFIHLWQRCQQQGREQVETVEISQRGLFLQVIITPLRDEDLTAEPRGYLVIFQNLTPIRRLETIRRDFISNLSHELRTPLASLKAVVETLRDGALEDLAVAGRFLDRADREVDALTQMVQELLELSRIESGKVPLRLRPTTLAEIVLPAVDRLRPQAERNQLNLRLEIPTDLPSLMVDGERIQQVVTNLVHNAIKFTSAGGQIVIRGGRQAELVVVEVADNGVGIPAGDIPRIFERFYKADRARSQGGTGLGLAIARHLVQAHGGQIWAKSKEGKGSTFYFTLPMIK